MLFHGPLDNVRLSDAVSMFTLVARALIDAGNHNRQNRTVGKLLPILSVPKSG